MRKSPLRHPLAVVRVKILGLTQRELAAMVGCSKVTIQKVELRDEKLSLPPALASRLEHELGISAAYLLAGNPRKPPVTPRGGPFTKLGYEAHRAKLEAGMRPEKSAFFPFREIAELGAIASAAGDKGRLAFFNYKLDRTIRELRKEFGADEAARGIISAACGHERLKKDLKRNFLGDPAVQGRVEQICNAHALRDKCVVHDVGLSEGEIAQLARAEGRPRRIVTTSRVVEVARKRAVKRRPRPRSR
jgi:transcriptional regulator with XRE-family HTH domain